MAWHTLIWKLHIGHHFGEVGKVCGYCQPQGCEELSPSQRSSPPNPHLPQEAAPGSAHLENAEGECTMQHPQPDPLNGCTEPKQEVRRVPGGVEKPWWMLPHQCRIEAHRYPSLHEVRAEKKSRWHPPPPTPPRTHPIPRRPLCCCPGCGRSPPECELAHAEGMRVHRPSCLLPPRRKKSPA